jgi:cytochrome c oxidase subunit 2
LHALAPALPAIGGLGANDVFNPQSPLARATTDLLNLTLIVSAVILTLVSVLVLVCILRFRARPSAPGEPEQFHGHNRLELVWTAGPILLLAYLFVMTVQAMRASDPPTANQTPDVVVTGHQFWWEVRYPGSGVVTANEIHIPVGKKLLFELRSADVIHDFWVAQLSRKMDAIPEQPNSIWIEADRAGAYPGACSEFCGAQHAWMRLLVIAEPKDEFESWQKRQLESAARPEGAAAQRGALLFQRLTCVNCHAIGGSTTPVQPGPDLRHVAARTTLGAGVVANTPEGLARWIKNPQALKPGNLMPSMRLNQEQVSDLATYLAQLR